MGKGEWAGWLLGDGGIALEVVMEVEEGAWARMHGGDSPT